MKQQLLVAAILLLNPLSAFATDSATDLSAQPMTSSLIMEDFNTNSIIYTNSEGKVVIEKKNDSNGADDKLVKLLVDSPDLTISQK